MLFSARDRGQIEAIHDRLIASGILCEIREFCVEAEESGTAIYPELWVQANPDYHTASILYTSPVSLLRQRAADLHHTASNQNRLGRLSYLGGGEG